MLAMARARASLRGYPFSRQLNGRLKHLREAHRAPAVQQNVPCVDHPGNSAGEQPVAVRNLAAVILFVPLDGRELGGARLGVNGDHLLLARHVDQNHRVAAHTVKGKSATASAAWPAHDASKAFPPSARMRRAASVASAFIEETAACRPRMTGRMVCGGAGLSGAEAIGARPSRKINTQEPKTNCESVIETSLKQARRAISKSLTDARLFKAPNLHLEGIP